MCPRIVSGVILSLCSLQLLGLELSDYVLIDLTHPYNENTLYWPTSPTKFEKKELAHGVTADGYFYSAYSISTPEHGGTHLDAPIHFSADGASTEQIPLKNLIGNAVVIDVRTKTFTNRNYQLTTNDVLSFEGQFGRIKPGDIVLLLTGWSKHWPDAKTYLGDDTPGEASNLQFPAYGADAARLLVEERKVAILGVDTASTDYGKSTDFMVHRIAAAQGVSNLENLTGLEKLPPNGAIIFALPMKIAGGSGGPVRVVALVAKRKAMF